MSKFNAKAVAARLKAVHETDPVADLAKELHDAGVTEKQLHETIHDDPAWDRAVPYPLALELYNKFRDIEHLGWTVNRYGVIKR